MGYCQLCGTALQSREHDGAIRPVCPRCGWVHYHHLKVGAGALIEKADRILLVRRAQEPFRGSWSLPSGYVEADEDPRVAAAREVLEETGFTASIGDVFDTFFYEDDPRGNGILLVYRGVVLTGEPRLGAENDALEWFERSGVPAAVAGGGHDQAIAKWCNEDFPYLSAAELKALDYASLKGQIVLSIIRNELGQILLHQRDDAAGVHFPGIWALFGGTWTKEKTPLPRFAASLKKN